MTANTIKKCLRISRSQSRCGIPAGDGKIASLFYSVKVGDPRSGWVQAHQVQQHDKEIVCEYTEDSTELSPLIKEKVGVMYFTLKYKIVFVPPDPSHTPVSASR